MSHIPHRKEKDCLNCGTIVQGKYCHNCGQENVEPKETFWHMVTHFFYDITHFDSNFFTTVKDLLFKPGFLSKEYMKGRRVSYLHPVRVYVFTSAIFFLLFFSFFVSSESISPRVNKPVSAEQRADYVKELELRLAKDSSNPWLKERIAFAKDSTHALMASDILKFELNNGLRINFTGTNYNSFEEYDSMEKTLPPSKRDGWVVRRLVRMDINIRRKVSENPDEVTKEFVDSVLHRLPYLLLISLPFFALILKLVYLRRKQFYYADHGVFTIHLYVFTFIWLLLFLTLRAIEEKYHWSFIGTLSTILVFVLLFYLFRAMKNFYQQGWAKTFFKFLIVAISSLFMILILLLLFMFFSAATL
ncbi:MAG: DUF3667 domain-containing protein [Sphingobacteriales bacterium]|nr:DUF3667 domain-containing protein [Sphingobacteriales bacterium]